MGYGVEKMDGGKIMNEYKRFLAVWDCIHIMNMNGVYAYGYATHGDGGCIVRFENDEQKQRYMEIFK